MLSTRDYLILLITNMSHKAHLLSCALRCSSKLQTIQSLENFVSMAVQGMQVPMYTNSHCFCKFLFYFLRDNYSKPTCGMTRFHFDYLWFKTLYFAHLNFKFLPIHYPPLLKSGVKTYFIFTFNKENSNKQYQRGGFVA